MKGLRDGKLRDAFRLTEAAMEIVSLGGMFSSQVNQAAGEYLLVQAAGEIEPEKTVLTAIADYLLTQSKD